MFEDIIIAIFILAGLTLLVIMPNIKIIREHEVSIVERLGRFSKILKGPGIFMIIPLIDRTVETIFLGKKTWEESLEDQESKVITFKIDYIIKDPKAFCYITLDAEKDFKKDIKELHLSLLKDDIHIELLNEYAHPYGIEIINYVIL